MTILSFVEKQSGMGFFWVKIVNLAIKVYGLITISWFEWFDQQIVQIMDGKFFIIFRKSEFWLNLLLSFGEIFLSFDDF